MTIEVSPDVEVAVLEVARQTHRQPSEVVEEALKQYLDAQVKPAATHRVIDIKPLDKGGKILDLGTTREELLSDFFDDRT